MKKFYRYLIYKLYSWGLKRPGDTPIANVIFTLTFVHAVQLLSLYAIIGQIVPQVAIFDNLPKVYIGSFFIVFSVIHYFIIYDKKRWENYLEEFKNEKPQESRQGKWLVLGYLIGSIVLFFILMPVLFR